MYTSELTFRVRYAEADRMGYAYYSHYSTWFEVARVEALRELGITYKELEDNGVLLPVKSYEIDFLKPAYYDDELTIKTTIPSIPTARMLFDYETYNADGDLLNKAKITLVFIDLEKNKPCPAPQHLLDIFEPYFSD